MPGPPKEKKPSKSKKKKAPVPANSEKLETQVVENCSKEELALVDKTINFIKQRVDRVTKYYLEIGDHLLKNYYDNNIINATKKGPTKINAFHKLSKHSGLNISSSRLNRMVNVAAQEKFLKESGVENLEDMSFEHKAELLPLDNDENKVRLAKQCIEDSLSVRSFRTMLKKYKIPRTREPKTDIKDLAKDFTAHTDKLINNYGLTSLSSFHSKIFRQLSDDKRSLVKKNALEMINNCQEILDRIKEIEKPE